MGVDCDTNQYLVAEKVRERLPESKQAPWKFDIERFNLRKQSELEVRKQYRIKISKSCASLEDLMIART